MPSHGNREHADQRLASALAAGATVADAAKTAGLSPRTAARRLNDPTFRAMLDSLRADHLREAAGRLARSSTAAADKLVALADGAVSEGVQLRAAQLVIELGLRVRDQLDVEARLDELEARIDARELGE